MLNPCDTIPDPLGGVVLPDGYAAVPVVVNGEIVWTTDPETPTPLGETYLELQTGSPLLIATGVSLLIA